MVKKYGKKFKGVGNVAGVASLSTVFDVLKIAKDKKVDAEEFKGVLASALVMLCSDIHKDNNMKPKFDEIDYKEKINIHIPLAVDGGSLVGYVVVIGEFKDGDDNV